MKLKQKLLSSSGLQCNKPVDCNLIYKYSYRSKEIIIYILSTLLRYLLKGNKILNTSISVYYVTPLREIVEF